MGVFTENQPVFDDLRIPTFPIREKAPAVRGWNKGTSKQLLSRSRAWARHKSFQNDDAFGFLCGEVSGLTVLDIDTPDEKVQARILDWFGHSPFLVRTHSGKLHAYYRHSGEPRKIRVPGLGGPVDVLGALGLAVAPPSIGAKGKYEIVQGDLGDLANLPRMRPLASMPAPRGAAQACVAEAAKSIGPRGQRNNDLLHLLLRISPSYTGGEELRRFALATNAEHLNPLPTPEVEAVAASAWRIQNEGRNRVGVGRYMMTTFEQFDQFADAGGVGQDADWLLRKVKRSCGGKAAFFIANNLSADLGWSLPRLRGARGFLEEINAVIVLRKWSKKLGPTAYRWPQTLPNDAAKALALLDAGRSGARM